VSAHLYYIIINIMIVNDTHAEGNASEIDVTDCIILLCAMEAFLLKFVFIFLLNVKLFFYIIPRLLDNIVKIYIIIIGFNNFFYENKSHSTVRHILSGMTVTRSVYCIFLLTR